jgi:hypothetical protein
MVAITLAHMSALPLERAEATGCSLFLVLIFFRVSGASQLDLIFSGLIGKGVEQDSVLVIAQGNTNSA